jgi:hypothetical protein
MHHIFQLLGDLNGILGTLFKKSKKFPLSGYKRKFEQRRAPLPAEPRKQKQTDSSLNFLKESVKLAEGH